MTNVLFFTKKVNKIHCANRQADRDTSMKSVSCTLIAPKASIKTTIAEKAAKGPFFENNNSRNVSKLFNSDNVRGINRKGSLSTWFGKTTNPKIIQPANNSNVRSQSRSPIRKRHSFVFERKILTRCFIHKRGVGGKRILTGRSKSI